MPSQGLLKSLINLTWHSLFPEIVNIFNLLSAYMKPVLHNRRRVMRLYIKGNRGENLVDLKI